MWFFEKSKGLFSERNQLALPAAHCPIMQKVALPFGNATDE
jgi:hypothetical protein